jgi:hypothetical protein
MNHRVIGTSGREEERRRPGRQFGDAKVRKKSRNAGWWAASVVFHVIAFGGLEGNEEDAGGEDGGEEPGERGGADIGGEGRSAVELNVFHLGEEKECKGHGNLRGDKPNGS